MEKEQILPIFYQCSICQRNILGTTKLWADIDKRICSCCECMGATDESTIRNCKRINCKLHHHIYDDYITEVTDPPKIDKTENKKGEVEKYDEKSHLCYLCRENLYDEYYFVNSKFSLFEMGDAKNPTKKAQVKVKFCKKCFDSLFEKANLEFKNCEK